MQGVLRVISGSAFGRVVPLDPARAITIGRSEETDVSFPDDLLMSSRHCRISASTDGFHLEDLNSTNGTFVNGAQITRRLLRDGDSVRCGDTELQAAIDMGAADPPAGSIVSPVAVPPRSATPAPVAPTREITPPEHQHHNHAHPHIQAPPPASAVPFNPEDLGPEVGYISQSAMSIFERFNLKDVIESPPTEAESVEEYLERLTKIEKLVDAMKFLAYALPRRSAVWWGRECAIAGVDGHTAPGDAEVLEAATVWVKEPSDATRRRAMSAAEAIQFATAAAWVGVGAFWSHGSMGPPNVPAVPPAPDLVGKAVSGAVHLASVAHQPEHAEQRQKSFIQLGRRIAAQPQPWQS
jgi:pSer/pThr/pTyr-binding forkhead associated (FHA) protein